MKEVDFAFLRNLQLSSGKVASSEPYAACGDKAKEVVLGSFKLAKTVSYELTGEAYSPDKQSGDTAERRYEFVYIAMQIEQKCSHLPADIRPDVLSVFEKIRKNMKQKNGEEFITQIERRIESQKQAVFEKAGVCSTRSHALVNASLEAIRNLEKEY